MPGSYIIKARVQMLRDLGMAVSPFNAFLILQGLETLSLRMERHFANADRVAQFLVDHPQVEHVAYAGLPSSPWHERAKKYGGGKGYGSVLAFDIKAPEGSTAKEAGQRFVEALELHSHVANIGDVRSLVIHPASTTHSQLSTEEQASAGVRPRIGAPQRRAGDHRRHPRRPRPRLCRGEGLTFRRSREPCRSTAFSRPSATVLPITTSISPARKGSSASCQRRSSASRRRPRMCTSDVWPIRERRSQPSASEPSPTWTSSTRMSVPAIASTPTTSASRAVAARLVPTLS